MESRQPIQRSEMSRLDSRSHSRTDGVLSAILTRNMQGLLIVFEGHAQRKVHGCQLHTPPFINHLLCRVYNFHLPRPANVQTGEEHAQILPSYVRLFGKCGARLGSLAAMLCGPSATKFSANYMAGVSCVRQFPVFHGLDCKYSGRDRRVLANFCCLGEASYVAGNDW